MKQVQIDARYILSLNLYGHLIVIVSPKSMKKEPNIKPKQKRSTSKHSRAKNQSAISQGYDKQAMITLQEMAVFNS